jgi:hypothetical protein
MRIDQETVARAWDAFQAAAAAWAAYQVLVSILETMRGRDAG